MSKQTVFLVGATGETGSVILKALLDDGSFDVTCFIRSSSADKPAVQGLRDMGLKIVTGDLSNTNGEILGHLRGIDTVISSIFPMSIKDQLPLIDASVKAGVRRFVPCNWGTPAARGGIMRMRDLKEEVHDHIFRHHLGFTIIDVGYWYEMSCPRVPSGRFDHALFLPLPQVVAGGTAPNMLMDKKDVGRITARIIKDDRTLNKRVYACAEVLSQNEISAIVEQKTGEKPELIPVSSDEALANLEAARREAAANPTDILQVYKVAQCEYSYTKYVRKDNTPENAEYLGYLDGRKLYPDFEFMSFSEFVEELVAGNVKRAYPHLQLPV